MAPTDQEHAREPASPSPRRVRFGWWLGIFVALLALNYWAGSRAMDGESRVRVPYSPFFVEQVRAGNVVEITSEGTAIQGMLAQAESYDGSEPTTRFETEIPAFADTEGLSRLLESEGVVENARPLDTGGSLWTRLLIGFGPTLLFVGLLFWLARRAGNAQNALGAFGRSSARRYQPTGDRVTFADERVPEALDTGALELDVVGRPPDLELVASRDHRLSRYIPSSLTVQCCRQLARSCRPTTFTDVAPRLPGGHRRLVRR